jgi:hypothetical protein
MATISYSLPRLVGSGPIREPKLVPVMPTQNAAWRAGDLVVQSTTGSVVNPPAAGSGSLAGIAGPASSAITTGTSASSGAVAASYFCQVTYTGTSAESLPSSGFIINVPAGYVPTVTVASSGAPSGATGFNTYLGLLPGVYIKQNSSATSLGSAFTAAYPLTNYFGANRGASNLSSNIYGLALSDSQSSFFGGPGGSFTAGTPNSLLGATNTIPPLAPTDAYFLYVCSLSSNQRIEINLNQNTAYAPNLNTTTAGLTLDSSTGIWTVDPTQSNKIFTIERLAGGVAIGPTASGSVGDLGARVIGYFNSGLIA